jgi:protein TonB
MNKVIINKLPENKKVLLFVAISLFIHAVISIVHIQSNAPINLLSENKQTEQKILIKLLKTKASKQIVATEESKIKDLAKLKKTAKLSKSNNVFERETQAVNGQTFKSAGLGVKNAQDQKTQSQKLQKLSKKLEKIKFSDLGLKQKNLEVSKFKKKKTVKQSVAKGLKTGVRKARGLGSTSDHLEDIPLGDFTKLNTQEYEYYGFYNRIKQKLEQFWGFNIRDKAEKIFKQGRSIASEANLVTGLTISLNDKGEIVDILVKSASGIKELDDAAIESFNQAGPFPNPPKGMLKNGKATIEWGFVVNT